jgi:hypothetical protein
MKAKVTKLKTNLVGMTVPDSTNGHAGRFVESEIIREGFDVDTKGTVDIPGLDIEVKTRDINAISAQTVGSMTPENIKKTPYRESSVYEKIQRQFRVYIRDNTIIDAKVVDFSWDIIQQKIEQSYELARQRIIDGLDDNYISGGPYGYFERTVKGSSSYDFRLRDTAMKKLESMANSTARDLYTFE